MLLPAQVLRKPSIDSWSLLLAPVSLFPPLTLSFPSPHPCTPSSSPLYAPLLCPSLSHIPTLSLILLFRLPHTPSLPPQPPSLGLCHHNAHFCHSLSTLHIKAPRPIHLSIPMTFIIQQKVVLLSYFLFFLTFTCVIDISFYNTTWWPWDWTYRERVNFLSEFGFSEF